jgi:AraC-like DNA-binding protein
VTRVDLHQLWMLRGSQTLAHTLRYVTPKGRRSIFFLSDENQPSVYLGGAEIRASDLVRYSAEAEHHDRLPARGTWAAMSMTPEDLAAAGRKIIGRELLTPGVTTIVRPPPEALARLQSLHRAVGDLAIADPSVLTSPEVAKAIEDSLLRALVAAVEPAADDERRLVTRGTAIMRRFEDVLEAHEDEPLYLVEICGALGVPERTLRLHCAQHLGMGPHRYLWLRRLHLARRALAKADPSKTTVTTVANDHGFGELGRFSVTYREIFGESPSATLLRADAGSDVETIRPERNLPILHSRALGLLS